MKLTKEQKQDIWNTGNCDEIMQTALARQALAYVERNFPQLKGDEIIKASGIYVEGFLNKNDPSE